MKKLVYSLIALHLIIVIFSPTVAKANYSDPQIEIRSGSKVDGGAWHEEYRQEQNNPNSGDTRDFYVAVNLRTLRPSWDMDSDFSWARVITRYNLPFEPERRYEHEGRDVRVISNSNHKQIIDNRVVEVEITTFFEWQYPDSGFNSQNLNKVKYTFTR